MLDRGLAERLVATGAALIEGPKACGKTASASQKANATYRLEAEAQSRDAAAVAPELLLDSPGPVLLDERQPVPTLWDDVRRAVDDRSPTKGLYIVTGSVTPNDDVGRHSGAGRTDLHRGWPALLGADPPDAGTWLEDYVAQIILADIQGLGIRRRDPDNIRRL